MKENNKYVLGISGLYHDSAAAIIKNDEIIAAAQEERFSRTKHDSRFPVNAINYCIEEAFIEPDQIDAIVYYDNPLVTWDRIVKNSIVVGEKSKDMFIAAGKSILGNKLWVQDEVIRSVGGLGKYGKLVYAGHHMSHASSAFYPSPFNESAILTVDGVGEWATTTIAHGNGKTISLLKEINYPHSLGLLYSAFTSFCGFKVNSGEYKLMGLAPYGTPKYMNIILDNLIDVKEDGSFCLNTFFFGFMEGKESTNANFYELFGRGPRKPESIIERFHMDIAASIQKVTEIIMIRLARTASIITGSKNLCLAGGVALNCVANGKILKEEIFDNIWIQPASGDAGGALGAAFVGVHQLLGIDRKTKNKDSMLDSQKGSYLGNNFSEIQIDSYLTKNNYPFVKYLTATERNSILAKEISEGKIVGYFAGRMEYGPRSLGARSILGDARNVEMQSKMNLKIKYRESFRPFAPIVIGEDKSEYFDISTESPYMLMVAPINEDRRISVELSVSDSDDMIKIVNQKRSDIPSVTHVDFSARLQTVHQHTNADLYDLLKQFKELTGFGVLINTSFNVRGEPIVSSLSDAYTCFMRTEIDILVFENYVLYKKDQPKLEDNENWKDKFELD